MSKMTDNHIADDGKKVEEVIKALEFCSHCVCDDDKTETKCPYYNMPFCKNYLRKQSLDVINRQQTEIERLKEEVAFKSLKCNLLEQEKAKNISSFVDDLKLVRAEAIKEFADRLKADTNKTWYYELENDTHNARALERVDELVKKMVGEGSES
jgi:hypothetical protein